MYVALELVLYVYSHVHVCLAVKFTVSVLTSSLAMLVAAAAKFWQFANF